MSIRRVLVAMLLLSPWLGSFAASARAASTGPAKCVNVDTAQVCESYGDRYTSIGYANGTRSYIAGSGSSYPSGDVITSVSVQDGIYESEDSETGYSGVMRVGEAERSGGITDLCGHGVADYVFVEYRVSATATMHCPYSSLISNFGSGTFVAVLYQSGSWIAKENGSQIGAAAPSLGFTSGVAVAGDSALLVTGAPLPSEAITFGPVNHNPWQYTTNNGSTWPDVVTSYVDQNTDSDGDLDGDWGLGASPSPFNINWTGW